ncbi:hypothetical protein [Paraburkholderia sacchari]|uniref:hypothetical protein n=1 Tax=Paraburkholderia sacchari TaxID=159450 RepID=UPI001BD1A4E1|nr:hypothetical protein [Paraburkholderia sacchari]
MSLTTDPNDPKLEQIRPNGHQESYLVLSEEERAKGFVRPVRRSYRHVGQQPKHPLRDLTPEEHARYDRFGYVKFEAHPDSGSGVTGRFWTQAQLEDRSCGSVTTMGLALAETYARSPKFYGGTFCCGCNRHFPVAEFVWEGTQEVVGS